MRFAKQKTLLFQPCQAIAESRRTESYWVKSTIRDSGGKATAELVLNHATLKESYAEYPKELLTG